MGTLVSILCISVVAEGETVCVCVYELGGLSRLPTCTEAYCGSIYLDQTFQPNYSGIIPHELVVSRSAAYIRRPRIVGRNRDRSTPRDHLAQLDLEKRRAHYTA